ncbi:MAG: hypothetical protein Q8M03_14665 [Legionella sp.]|nr:hypothetical protein [Legionella sp.]
MKYQLVIQFPEELYEDIDAIVEMEDKLDEIIDAEVDGHDKGSGEINIFIHTNNPVDTFNDVKNVLENDFNNLNSVKIAYREMSAEEYIVLWPEGLTKFNVI